MLGPPRGFAQVPYLIAVCVLPFAWEMCRIKRRYFILHPRSVLLCFSTRGAPSRGPLNLVVADSVGNCARAALSAAFLGNLLKLN